MISTIHTRTVDCKNKVNLEIPKVNVYAKRFLLLDLTFTASSGYNDIALNGYARQSGSYTLPHSLQLFAVCIYVLCIFRGLALDSERHSAMAATMLPSVYIPRYNV